MKTSWWMARTYIPQDRLSIVIVVMSSKSENRLNRSEPSFLKRDRA